MSKAHSRYVTSLATALICAAGIAANAQSTTTSKTKTKVHGDAAKTMTYTGCVQTGTEARSYVLENVVPVGKTETTEVTGTGGTVTNSSTTYMLVPGQRVELQQRVGHKVQVTGMMVPAGNTTKTKTKIEGAHGNDTTITEKSEGNTPHFRVISVKQLSDRC